MTKIKNQTVWITGASDGIGKALAIAMAKKGARIILTARNEKKLNAVKESLAGDSHMVFPMDLLKTDEIQSKANELLSKVNHIDILVNNAGITQRSLTKDTALEVDRKIMELDYFAVIILTKAVLPSMLARKSGLIVSVSSLAGKVGIPFRSAYCAAKHAVIGFMGALRAESKADNIKVLVVSPGSIRTDISKHALEGDGSTHNIVDPLVANGMPVEECARQMVEAIETDKSDLNVAKGGEMKLAENFLQTPEQLDALFEAVSTMQAK